MTGDTWSQDNNKQPFLGATATWVAISPQTRVWSMEHKVVGFRGIFGPHNGSNLGGYFIGVCRRVGIVDVEKKISRVSVRDDMKIVLLMCVSSDRSRWTTQPTTVQPVSRLKVSIRVSS